MDFGNAPESARHSEPSGTDAGRQRVFAGDARIWRPWNFAALGRRDTPADVTTLLIQRPRQHSPVSPEPSAFSDPSPRGSAPISAEVTSWLRGTEMVTDEG